MNNKVIDIIGVPIDLGANIRGACMGPHAIRIAQLHNKLAALDYKSVDKGDILIPIRETLSPANKPEIFKKIIIETAQILADSVEESLLNDHFPIAIGGDHSLAIGSIAGVAKYHLSKKKTFGLIWIDAHADINTFDTSPSGNIHGMPLASLLGLGDPKLANIHYEGAKLDPKKVVIIGLRNVDGLEKELCKKSGVHYFTMRDIDEKGMPLVCKEAVKLLEDTDSLHVSFDIDAIDPLYAPGVSTAETGGISYREAHLLLEIIADTQKLSSMDIVELNPSRDIENKTSRLAVELIQSALGKSII